MALAAVALMLCGVLAPAVAQEAGSPVVVKATPGFNPGGGIYMTPEQNPNPDAKVDWTLAYPPPKDSVIAIGNALIPGSQNAFLFVGRHAGGQAEVLPFKEYLAATLDLEAEGGPKISNVTAESDLFCSIPVQTSDGRVLVVSGSEANGNGFKDGLKELRVFDYKADPTDLKSIATMQCGRWYPTATVMPDTTIMLQGGTGTASEFGPKCPVLERWDPKEPTLSPPVSYPVEPTFLKSTFRNFYPFQFVLPTGDLYIQNNNQVRFLKPDGSYRVVDNVPPFPENIATEWPRSAAMVAGPLTYKDNFTSVDIITMGGTPADAPCSYGPPGNEIQASRGVRRLKITWKIEDGEPVYSFKGWDIEDMGVPRVGGDGTLLPGGDIFLTSGSQRGCHGASKGGQQRNSRPALWPILYQPDLPLNERVTVLQATPIARVYHMSAVLTLEGKVMVAGCDVCQPSTSFKNGIDRQLVDTWWSPSVTGRRDFRTELFSSPYVLDEANRPKIVSINGVQDFKQVINAKYGDVLTITWSSDVPSDTMPLVPVTGFSLVAPSAATHGYNTNQRVLFLQTDVTPPAAGATTGTVKVTLPPNSKVAPPQQYLLFALNRKTNSRAWWINLQMEA